MNRALILGCVLILAGCSGDDEKTAEAEEEVELPAVDCETETVPKFSEMTVFTAKCNQCHSTTKTGDDRGPALGADEPAPAGLNFDDYDAAKTWAHKAAEEMYEDERGAMPPAESSVPAATADEKHMILVWAECGTPDG